MLCVDINTNYNDQGGGIRTYHQQKIAWFREHPEHEYVLMVPGPRRSEVRIAPNVRRLEFFGIPLVSGYRLLVDYPGIYGALRRLRPDVVEAGDPYLTGLFCLTAKRLRRFDGLLSSFYHSDPMRTFVVPWKQRRGWLRPIRQLLGRLVESGFYVLQRSYDRTLVTSRQMENHLRSRGVAKTARLPFGVDAHCFADFTSDPGREAPSERRSPVRLLYSGRLCRDKAIELVEAVVPRLLETQRFEVTVIGRGISDHPLMHLSHPRYRYLGYVADRREVARIYREHDILLAPGPYETFGLGVLEGLAAGLVVVGPDAGGAGELLGELPAGFRFRAGDADDFFHIVLAAAECDFAQRRRDAVALARSYGTSDEAIGRMIEYYRREIMPPGETVNDSDAVARSPMTAATADSPCRV